MKIYIVVTNVVNDVTYSRKYNTRVVIMTLSAGHQQRHMINVHICLKFVSPVQYYVYVRRAGVYSENVFCKWGFNVLQSS